jgi:2-(1,2-epoxy-1,2-dihydrophenyl)acetyl-CoA isomerase
MATIAGTDVLAVARDGGVLTLTLNRPDRLNSLDDALLSALLGAVRAAGEDDSVRAVVITGAGRGFSAGADLTQPRLSGHTSGDSRGATVRQHLHDHYHPLITGIRELEKPVLAAVNGVAAGAGLSLALACDLRIAAESAYLIQAFVRIGLVPDAGSTYFLPRLVGMGKAMELAMLGERISAAEALSVGLVNRVVPDASLGAAAAEMAGRLAAGPRSLGLIKRLLYLSTESDLGTQLRREEEAQAFAADTDDFIEGVAAFVEKRPAQFRGR